MAELIIIGILLEIPKQAERCGDNAVAVVFKFEVADVLVGRLEQKYILAAIPCPDLKPEGFFVKDAQYKIELASDLGETENYLMHNQYADEALHVFWCREIERAE